MNYAYGLNYGLLKYEVTLNKQRQLYSIDIEPNFNTDIAKITECCTLNSIKNQKRPKIFNSSTFNKYEKQDGQKAFDYCQRCFTKNPNDAKLMTFLGHCYNEGIGTTVNKKKLLRVISKQMS